MKKVIIFASAIVLALGLSSCVENSSKYKALQAQLDSLQTSHNIQGAELDELFATFPDIIPYAAGCTYSDCSHVGEGADECAVARAAKEGKIAESRLESYRSVWRTLKAKSGY